MLRPTYRDLASALHALDCSGLSPWHPERLAKEAAIIRALAELRAGEARVARGGTLH